MTPKQLEKLGLFREFPKLKPNKYWCNACQSYITVYKTDTVDDVLKSIFEKGYELGIEEGKERRSDEIKKLLNI